MSGSSAAPRPLATFGAADPFGGSFRSSTLKTKTPKTVEFEDTVSAKLTLEYLAWIPTVVALLGWILGILVVMVATGVGAVTIIYLAVDELEDILGSVASSLESIAESIQAIAAIVVSLYALIIQIAADHFPPT